MSFYDQGWLISDIECALRHLDCHRGFPMGLALQCPIFSGDKFNYLKSVFEIVQPTLSIPLHLYDGIDSQQSISFITEWFRINRPIEEGSGYLLKAPYVQHQVSFPILTFPGASSLIDYIRCNEESLETSCSSSINTSSTTRFKSGNKSDIFNYLMLQQFNSHASSKERKVLLFNGNAFGFNISGSQCAPAAKEDVARYFLFAERAIALLKLRCPHAIVDGLTRVDIFPMDAAATVLVVNEFESLDASFTSSEATQMKAQGFVQEYWLNKMNELIDDVLLIT